MGRWIHSRIDREASALVGGQGRLLEPDRSEVHRPKLNWASLINSGLIRNRIKFLIKILNISGYISNFKIVTIQFLDQSSLIQKFLKFDLKFNSISDRPKIYWTGPIRFQSMDFEPVQFQPNSYHGTMRWIHEMWTEMLWREMNLLYWEIFLWARCICYTVIVFVSLSRIGIWKFLP